MSKITWSDAMCEALETVYNECRENEMNNNDTWAECQKLETFKDCTVPMLRGKAVILGFYRADKTATKGKKGEAKSATKAATVKALEIILSLSEGALGSLEKATAKDLKTLQDALIKAGSKPEYGEQ